MADWAQEQGWRRPLAAAFGFALVFLAILFGALGVAVAIAIASIIAIPSLRSLSRHLPLEFPVAVFLIFIAWCWISVSWSPVDRGQALKMVVGFPLYALFAWNVWSLRGKGRYLVLLVATIAGAVTLLGSFINVFTGFSQQFYASEEARALVFSTLTRGASAVTMFVPVMWAFLNMLLPGWRGIAASIVAGLLAFLISWKVGLDAGMIAVVLSAIVYGIGYMVPRTSILLVGLGGAGMITLAPIYMEGVVQWLGNGRELPLSWQIRLENWRFVLDQIPDRSLFGWGLDASRAFNAKYMLDGYHLPNVSMHPHNIGLQMWLETGLLGVLLFALSLLLLTARASMARALSRAQGASIAACFSAFLVFASLSYGAWQEWLWGMFGLLAALCVLVGPEPAEEVAY